MNRQRFSPQRKAADMAGFDTRRGIHSHVVETGDHMLLAGDHKGRPCDAAG